MEVALSCPRRLLATLLPLCPATRCCAAAAAVLPPTRCPVHAAVGFRRYDRIRETLLHELAHMVWVSEARRLLRCVWGDRGGEAAVRAG